MFTNYQLKPFDSNHNSLYKLCFIRLLWRSLPVYTSIKLCPTSRSTMRGFPVVPHVTVDYLPAAISSHSVMFTIRLHIDQTMPNITLKHPMRLLLVWHHNGLYASAHWFTFHRRSQPISLAAAVSHNYDNNASKMQGHWGASLSMYVFKHAWSWSSFFSRSYHGWGSVVGYQASRSEH